MQSQSTVRDPAGELPAAYQAAADLERVLGDPADSGRALCFDRLVAADDADLMPLSAMDALRAWGFPAYLVPRGVGGRLGAFDELFAICRSVARRDIRVAVSYGTTLLGANPVWLWGDDAQRRWLAGRLLAGELGSFAMSERDHGSDLAGCEVSARRVGDHYLLNGEKWPIGNATRGTFCTVYARTGPHQFALILAAKEELPPQRWRNSPRVPTVGLRGHDMSGIAFDDCPVPAGGLLGREGTGVAQTLKALQVTRTLIAALSLGALDTALRLAHAHARGRHLYGGSIAELPVIRDILVRAYLDLLIGECVAIPAARAISEAPDRLSLWSAIVKYFVPVTAERAVADLATVLSARGYLRDGLPARLFQKVRRDQEIAAIFEGTTHVNLSAIAGQLPFVYHRPAGGEAERALVRTLFDRGTPATPWAPDGRRLQLTNGGRDEITSCWPAAVAAVAAPGAASRPLRAVVARLDAARRAAGDRLDDVDASAARLAERGGADGAAGARQHPPVLAFTLARTHCVLHAAACVLQTWLHNRDTGHVPAGDAWVVACLERLVQHLDPAAQLSPAAFVGVERMLSEQVDGGALLSLTPVPLGR